MSNRSLPNILFVISDQHRPDWLGYNSRIPVRTPVIDSIASSGVHFTRAICPSPVCGPSRACLATGLEYDRNPVPNHDHNLPVDAPTLYQALRDHGYTTLGIGKFDLAKADHAWGLDGLRHLHQWGFTGGSECGGRRDLVKERPAKVCDPYTQYLEEKGLFEIFFENLIERKPYADTNTIPIPDEDYMDNWITRRSIEELNQIPRGEPWFLSVNYCGPHEPLEITPAMNSWYSEEVFPPPMADIDPAVDIPVKPRHDQQTFNTETHQEIRRNYSAMVENIDRGIGKLLDVVAKRGESENTWVIYCSDHGEMLGDRGLWTKQHPFQPSAGIPLVISGPDIAQAGRQDRSPISLIDLNATLLEIAGTDPLSGSDAVSFLPQLKGNAEKSRDYAFSGLDAWRPGAGHWRLVFDGRYKLVRYTDGSEREYFFDLENDPEERRDWSREASDKKQELAEALDKQLQATHSES